jgi:Spy/CpxP family protein refolding chaperone
MKELGQQIEKEIEPKLKEILTPEQWDKWQKKAEERRQQGGRPPGV